MRGQPAATHLAWAARSWRQHRQLFPGASRRTFKGGNDSKAKLKIPIKT
jgi:hypothetical protein